MLTKLFYTAFHMHGTHEMGWLLYLDALKGRKEQVAAWTPKRPHRWRDGKDKEPEVSPRLSLRHLAILTMSNLPLDPRLPMQSPSCCCIHVGLVDTNICRLLLSFCGATLSFPYLKDKISGKTARQLLIWHILPQRATHAFGLHEKRDLV